jgi:SAM-dependent methyltransferase
MLDYPPRLCPVCGQPGRKRLYQLSFEQPSGARLLEGYWVVVCENCGAGYADEIPPQEVFDTYYQTLSKYDAYDRVEAEPKAEIDRFDSIADLLVAAISDRKARILDIGCGSGQLLRHLASRGFENLLGVDPSPSCARSAKRLYGLKVITASLLTLSMPAGSSDVIITSGVLEHIRDLDTALETIRQLLAEKGILFVEVPDVTRFSEGTDGPFQEFSPEHINFFSIRSLTNLMARHGFRCLAAGQAMRAHFEVHYPAAYGLFEVHPTPSCFETDRVTESALRDYIAASTDADAETCKHILQSLNADEQIIVWGVGAHTLRLLATEGLPVERIALFVDIRSSYHGLSLRGVRIGSPEEAVGRTEAIFISSRGFMRQIATQARSIGCTNRIIYPIQDSG